MPKNKGRTPRVENDVYPTPWPLPLRICERMKQELGDWVPEVIIEPSAANGHFVYAAKLVWPTVPVVAVELRESERQNLINNGADLVCIEKFEDFAQRYRPPRRTLAIGNPPFNLAESHIRILLDFLHPGSYISFLLKMNFEGGIDRAEEFWAKEQNRYQFKVPVAGRPSFRKTELASNAWDEYSVYNWKVGLTGMGETHWPHIFWKEHGRGRNRRGANEARRENHRPG